MSNEQQECLLRTDHLSKHFKLADGRILKACDEISFALYRGETMAIVGESGCGKSTLVKTILGMHKATSGRVYFNGEDITDLTAEDKRQNYRHIQMVFQDPTAAFNPKMKVKDIICEPLRNYGRLTKGEAAARARELLRQVELPEDFADRYPHSMSGGQRQRVAIARALALEPEIIICDEATSALDVSVQARIIELLVRLQKEKGITCLFICHDLALVYLFAHRVTVMYQGKIVEQLAGKDLAEAQHPYTQKLLQAIFPVNDATVRN